MGCEIPILLPNDFQTSKWLWNELQAPKWLRKCSRLQSGLLNSPLAVKWFRSPIVPPVKSSICCENDLLIVKWFPNFKMGYENASIFSMGCKNVFIFSLWLPNGCEMTSKLRNDLQKHLAKPREIVKMPTKPRTMHLKRRALSLISHTWSLSFHFLPP